MQPEGCLDRSLSRKVPGIIVRILWPGPEVLFCVVFVASMVFVGRLADLAKWPNQLMQLGHSIIDIVHCCLGAEILVRWLMSVNSYVALILACFSHICTCYNLTVTYLPNLLGIFISDTYLAITCEVKVAFSCVLVCTV